MSDRKLESETVVIHERALKALGIEMALVALEVARDLRSGVIVENEYLQATFGSDCNSSCCIFGHIDSRMGNSVYGRPVRALRLQFKDCALGDLFNGGYPSHSKLAADAIENYILRGADYPWKSCK